jgi:hypothetical protein
MTLKYLSERESSSIFVCKVGGPPLIYSTAEQLSIIYTIAADTTGYLSPSSIFLTATLRLIPLIDIELYILTVAILDVNNFF